MTYFSVQRIGDAVPKRVPQVIGCDLDVVVLKARVFDGSESPGVNGLLIASMILKILLTGYGQDCRSRLQEKQRLGAREQSQWCIYYRKLFYSPGSKGTVTMMKTVPFVPGFDRFWTNMYNRLAKCPSCKGWLNTSLNRYGQKMCPKARAHNLLKMLDTAMKDSRDQQDN